MAKKQSINNSSKTKTKKKAASKAKIKNTKDKKSSLDKSGEPSHSKQDVGSYSTKQNADLNIKNQALLIKEQLQVLKSYIGEWSNKAFEAEPPISLEDIKNMEGDIDDIIQRFKRIEAGNLPLQVALVGSFSTGKSSFVNAYIGNDFIPVEPVRSSRIITRIHYLENNNKGGTFTIEALFKNGDSIPLSFDDYQSLNNYQSDSDFLRMNNLQIEDIELINIGMNLSGLANICIIDTPGFESVSDSGVSGGDNQTTMRYLKKADVLFWVFDASQGSPKESELKSIQEAKRYCPEIFAIVNMLDKKPPKERYKITAVRLTFSEELQHVEI